MTERFAEIIGLINREVKPALGCTEPIAVALAAVRAVEVMEEKCGFEGEHCGGSRSEVGVPNECGSRSVPSRKWMDSKGFSIRVEVSGNILKNGMGVGIPGVGMTGLPIAAALGAVCGRSEYGLEVLHDLNDDAVARAKRLVAEGKVRIDLAKTDRKLYVRASVAAIFDGEPSGLSFPVATSRGFSIEKHTAAAVILDEHDNIAETWFDGRQLTGAASGFAGENPACAAENPSDGIPQAPSEPYPAEPQASPDHGLTISEIYDFATTADFADISFILESKTLNLALAKEGLTNDYGLKVGKTIHASGHRDVFGDDFISYAMSLTAAATDARMAGCTLPAMSNSGSGNQGITVTMPVIAYALRNSIPDEPLARALVLSHLVAIHIKGSLGRLSALCGCVVASTGSSCGLVLLKGGGYEQVCSAIKNMIGNIMGMVCDGAKCGCALKVASGVSSSIQSAVLAMDGICISENDGIIDHDIERTIANLGRVGSVGMQTADDMILDIMVCK